MLEEGNKVPDFKLEGIDPEGREQSYSLKDLLAQKDFLVLYFYPKDSTPGCTTEACDFRDNLARLMPRAVVVGVSPDSVASHQRFHEKQSLNFPLLCDPEHNMMQAYGAWGEKNMYGKIKVGVIRSTCLIGQDGTLLRHWQRVAVKGHVDKVLEAIEQQS
ncbi:MAG: peroxiredoxin [bacterium]|nr:peroxiredoxin [bacterium]